MEERPPQPTDAEEWARIERRRRLLLWAGAAAAAVIVVAGGAWLVFGRTPKQAVPALYEPIPGSTAGTGSASAVPTAGTDATSGLSADVTGTPSNAPTQPGVAANCMIAYRRAGKLYVAKPDGSAEALVAVSADGVFAISPDARTLAYVDAGKRVLTLVDVDSGKTSDVGPAALERPVWPRGSDWCVYVGAGSQAGVRRVGRDGTGAMTLFAGTSPSVSPDGSTIAGIRESASGATVIIIYRDARASTIAISGYALDVAVGPARVFYAVAADEFRGAEIRSMDLSGSSGLVLKTGTQAGSRASFQDLCVSADGKRLAYAEAGDDGYSRLFALDAGDGGAFVSLSVRRDDYPLCWGCDGRLYFIEGNAWQGEATRLMAVRPDGTGRTVVLDGASR